MRFVLLIGLLLATQSALGQGIVAGRVVDAGTGELLAAATLQVAGTYTGTITNAEGRYELAIDAFPAELVVRHIGYETKRIRLAGAPVGAVTVRLEPAAVVLGEIEVTGENPAVAIMRRVIERKRQWRAALHQYRAEAYNRFTIRNDTGIVSIIESLTDVYWDADEGLHEDLKARRTTANLEIDAFLPAAEFVLNLYDDDIEIAGHRLIGVTHPDALDAYTFTLDGTRALDDQIVYDIGVRPRNRLVSGFVGQVAILGGEYAMIAAELRPGPAFYFPRPIERLETQYEQQFSTFGGDAWLPVDFRSQTEVKITLGFLLDFPAVYIDQVSRLTGYDLTVDLPDSIFADDRSGDLSAEADTVYAGGGVQVSITASEAVAARSDSLLDASGVAVPLSEPERIAYAGIDSTMTMERAFKPSGALARRIDMEEDGDDGGSGRGGPFERLGLDASPRLWYNRVEGGHLGLRLGRRAGPVRLQVEAGYQTSLKDWTYGGLLEVRAARRTEVGVGYRYGVESAYTSSLFEPAFNSLALLLGADDYFDYAREERVTGWVEQRIAGLPLTVRLGTAAARYRSVPATTGYDLLGDPEPPRLNPGVDDGLLRAATLRLELGDEIDPTGIVGGNRLIVDAEAAAPGLLGGDFAYTRLRVTADVRLKPYLRRRLIPPTLDVRLTGGVHGGTLPDQRLFALDGSLAGSIVNLTPFGGLHTLEGRPYLGDRYAAVLWEHSLRAIPFELLGLYGVARRGYNLILHGGHGRSWLDRGIDPFSSFYEPSVRTQALVPEGWHHELGLSFSGLLGLLRLDATWRLDRPGFTLGLSTARIF